jgi:hypothetical protein
MFFQYCHGKLCNLCLFWYCSHHLYSAVLEGMKEENGVVFLTSQFGLNPQLLCFFLLTFPLSLLCFLTCHSHLYHNLHCEHFPFIFMFKAFFGICLLFILNKPLPIPSHSVLCYILSHFLIFYLSLLVFQSLLLKNHISAAINLVVQDFTI